MKSRVLRERRRSSLAIAVGLTVVVVGLTVGEQAGSRFCFADGRLPVGIPNGYTYGRDIENSCAWTIYAPDGGPASYAAYADTNTIQYPGPRPTRCKTLALYGALILGPCLVGLGILGMWATRRRGHGDRGEQREATDSEL